MTPKLFANSIIQPLVPKVAGWAECEVPAPIIHMGYPARLWFHERDEITVISAVEVAIDAPGMEPNGPEYHLSMSRWSPIGPKRLPLHEANRVLIQFGAEGALEDNHVASGLVRNFWRPVADRNVGEVCACQATEPDIAEEKGDYVWRPAP